MNLIQSKPPKHIYDKAVEQFGVNWEDGVIFTYGDNIYTKYNLPNHLIAHESTHIKQQKSYGKDIWWDKYFIDEKFRYKQELEAYRKQYQFFKREVKDRNERNKFLVEIAKDLSGYIYGNLVSYQEALKEIKQ